MRRPLVILACFLLVLPLSLLLFGCSPVKSTANPNLIWKVDLLKFDVKDKLESVEVVQQYVGTTEQVHQQYPPDGKVFLIMDLTITKHGTDPVSFDWSKLTIQDAAGNTYQRSGNDTFLELYKYLPRISGLELKLGKAEGWLCYEILAQAANGKLTLIYSGDGSQQEIIVKK
jgi:hypothetical protein